MTLSFSFFNSSFIFNFIIFLISVFLGLKLKCSALSSRGVYYFLLFYVCDIYCIHICMILIVSILDDALHPSYYFYVFYSDDTHCIHLMIHTYMMIMISIIIFLKMILIVSIFLFLFSLLLNTCDDDNIHHIIS